jgi:hypothetical protein
MAQMGGVQAMQNMQQPGQQEMDPETENQIIQLIVPMINEEPSSILNDLVSNKGIPVEIAQPILMKVLTYKKEQEELDATLQTGNEEDIADVNAQENFIQEKSQNDLLVQQMMMQPDQNQGYAEEDEFVANNIMAYGGVPKKNSYVKNVMKLLKKQQGEEVQTKNVADDTDTGVRKSSLADFVSSLQTKANDALITQDAEAMYEQEFKRGGVSRQQRQINKGLNQIIKNTPAGFYNAGMPPMGVIGAQNIMGFPQAQGMPMPGGIKTANIDVKRTGIFGKPKEYSIALTYNDAMNPNMYRQMMEQESYNERNRTEEDVKDYAQERVDTATDKNEAVKEEVTKTSDASSSKYVTNQPSSGKPSAASVKPKSNVSPKASEEVIPEAPVTGSWLDNLSSNWDQFSQASKEIVDAQKAKDAITGERLENFWNQTIAPVINPNQPKAPQIAKTYKYNTEFTDPNATYYDPNKPGMIYWKQGDQWYYSGEGNNWNEVTDKSRVSKLNTTAKGADLYTLPSKPGYYYRMRGDGAYVRFEGDPSTHTEGKKPSGTIKPTDPNYQYLNKAKEYRVTYMPKKQLGGFADSSTPELNRFIYGGPEPMTYADDVPMQNTADPFFQYGGLTEYQDKGEVKLTEEQLAAKKRNEWIDQQMKSGYRDPYSGWDGTGSMPYVTASNASQQWKDEYYKRTGDPRYNNQYAQNMYNPYAVMGYGNAMMPQPGLYPPLFGGRQFKPKDKFIEYAGSWAQQQGLPTLIGTNTPYMGSLAGMRPTKISGQNRLLRPDTWSMEFDVPVSGSAFSSAYTPKTFYKGSDGELNWIGQSDAQPNMSSQTSSQQNLPGAIGPRSDEFMQNRWQNRAQRKGYDVDWSTDGMISPSQTNLPESSESTLLPAPQFTDEELGNNQMVDVQPEIFAPDYTNEELGMNQMVDIQPESFNMYDLQSMGYNVTPEDFYNERLGNENQMARQQFDIEQMQRGNVQRQYGGDVYKAQFGTSNCPPGYFKDPATGMCKNFAGEFYRAEASMPSADNSMENTFDLDQDYTNPLTGQAPGITMGQDGQYENQGLLTDNDMATQKIRADFKGKNMYNVDFLAGLNKFNNKVDFGVSALNAFTNRGIQDEFFTNLPFGNQPVKENIDRGDYDSNTGRFRADQQGFESPYKKGGSTYKKGGVTYLSSKQVQDLMKKGYKVEFIK